MHMSFNASYRVASTFWILVNGFSPPYGPPLLSPKNGYSELLHWVDTVEKLGASGRCLQITKTLTRSGAGIKSRATHSPRRRRLERHLEIRRLDFFDTIGRFQTLVTS